jgi:hypothetical protein
LESRITLKQLQGNIEMKRRSRVFAAIAMFAIVMFCGQAHAITLTVMADIDANDPGPPGGANAAPLENIEVMVAQGRTYVNGYVDGGAVGAPPALGDRIRTVFAVEITSATNGVANSPVLGPGAGTNSMVLIGALDGLTVGFDGSGNAIVAFGAGRAGIVNPALTGFLSNDPETWGAGATAAAVGAATSAEWSMEVTSDAVAPDNGFALFIPGGTLNTASIDPVNLLQTSGRFKFVEDSTAGDNPGDAFVTPLPSAGVQAFINAFGGLEGLVATSDLDLEATLDLTAEGLIGAADLAILNAIAAWAGLGDLGGAGTAFATALDTTAGGPYAATAWEIAPGNIASSGDFRSQGTIDIFPVVQLTAIPEPSTICIWAVGLVGVSVCQRLRSRRKQG